MDVASLANRQIAFVGGGTMAEAFIRGLLGKGLASPGQVVVGEPLAPRRDYLARELSIRTTADNAAAARDAEIVVLAVKPQAATAALAPLQGALREGVLVISIMAGVRLGALQTMLGVPAIVRVMPNTPAQVGEGICAWTKTPAVSDEQAALARAILSSLGEEVLLSDEDQVDMATALSGSGPAYVFLFIEALIDAGVQMGLARPIAEKLALQTVHGSASYAQQSALHLAVLRNMVTSPGGTTAEGLYALERGGLRATLVEAVLAAYRQARRLGGNETA
jgi:pyrroline-5-carboxylate reductase